MITYTIAEALQAYPGISRALEVKLPIATAHRLAKIGAWLQGELREYDESRVNLVKRYGAEIMTPAVEGKEATADTLAVPEVPAKPTGTWQLLPENIIQFTAEHEALVALEIKSDLDPVSLSDMGNTTELTAADLIACAKIILE